MKKIAYLLMAIAVVMLASQFSPAFCGQLKEDASLIGTWNVTVQSTDASGKPSPFVPEKMVFQKDNTMIMSNVPGMAFPYKTALTAEETKAIEAGNPELTGKRLLLIKPNPRMAWEETPMVYIYAVEKDELSLTLSGTSTSKFARQKK